MMVMDQAGWNPQLYATYEGKRVRCNMASRFGDLGITTDSRPTSTATTPACPVEMLSRLRGQAMSNQERSSTHVRHR
jgi:hypothetical protein